jgi:glycosyltransferase involved in cell wall biosynthesis
MHVVNLARALDDGPWRTRLVAGSLAPDEGDMTYYAEERGVAVTRLPSLARAVRPLADLRALWSLWRLFRRERPTVVHTHTAKAGTLGRIAAILAGVPVRIHTFHGHVLGGGYFPPAVTRVYLEVERRLARRTHRLVVLTETQAREMAEELGVAPRERFAVVPLGLELERFRTVDRAEAGARVRRSLGIGEGEMAVGIVGRLVPIKNHELFLEALAALRARRPAAVGGSGSRGAGRGGVGGAGAGAGADVPGAEAGAPARREGARPWEGGGTGGGGRVRGVVVGAGEREEELRARAAALGLEEDDVLWLGWRRDLPDLYAALDVVALTSHDEGTPVALLEALAAGTPAVAREVGGVGEVLRDAGAGRLVPREADAGTWARILARAVEEAGPVGLPSTVRDAVAERYSVERLAEDLTALYRREMEGP